MADNETMFHVRVFSKPAGLPEPVTVAIAGQTYHVIPSVPSALAGGLPVTWEAASDVLEQLGAFVEPDGSFVWASPGPPRWQIEGQLFERHDRLQFVEIKGHCSAARLDQLLPAFGWPAQQLAFELVREGVVVDEPEFRRLHGCSS